MASAQHRVVQTAEEPKPDRRADNRHQLVLRVGLLEQNGKSIFCLVKNISSAGVQVKPYGRVSPLETVELRVGDEDAISGTVVWSRDGLAGIQFVQQLHPQALLRIGQKMAAQRRRAAPRVALDLRACVRTGGAMHSVALCDLSMVGARLRSDRPIRFGETIIIEVPGLPSLRAFVRWSDGDEYGVSFEAPIPMQIIANLISGE